MPLSTGHKNKQKAWRKEAEIINAAVGSNHNGRRARSMGSQYAGSGPVAPEILIGMFERAGIKMPKAEAFRDMMNQLKTNSEKEEKVEAVV